MMLIMIAPMIIVDIDGVTVMTVMISVTPPLSRPKPKPRSTQKKPAANRGATRRAKA